MHVEADSMCIFAQYVAKLASRMLFVRALVFGEAHIAINTKHRPVMRPRIGNKMGRNLEQSWRHRFNEVTHRFHHLLLIIRFMLVKPFAIIIFCQGFKEFEEIWSEHIKLLHISLAGWAIV
jgi:hypothetical protein